MYGLFALLKIASLVALWVTVSDKWRIPVLSGVVDASPCTCSTLVRVFSGTNQVGVQVMFSISPCSGPQLYKFLFMIFFWHILVLAAT